MKLLDLLPDWALWLVLAIACAVLLGIGAAGGWAARGVVADKAVAEVRAELAGVRQELAELKAEHSKLVAEAAEASRKAEAAARDEEQRRAAAAQEIVDAERQAKTRRAVRGADLRRTVVGLRVYPSADGADSAAGPQAAQGPGLAFRSPPAAPADVVRWGLYVDLAERAESLAIALAESRAAGLACERIYDALTPRPPAVEEPQPLQGQAE